jgi:hypothetical protein
MKIMNKTLSAVLILFSVNGLLYAQKRKPHRTPEEFRFKKDSPTVYITFNRVARREPLRAGESDQGVWLRLHNNTRWPIVLEMNGVPSEYGDAGLFYDVLSERKVILEGRCHVCSSNRLSPGRSLVFSLPREDLGKGGAIRISFSYGWEDPDDVFAGREPEHYVYFYASKLPQTSQLGKQ